MRASVSTTALIPAAVDANTAILMMAYEKTYRYIQYVLVGSATGLFQGTDFVSNALKFLKAHLPPLIWKQRSWRNQDQNCSQPGPYGGEKSWLQWSLWLGSGDPGREISRNIAAATNISKFRHANLWHHKQKDLRLKLLPKVLQLNSN